MSEPVAAGLQDFITVVTAADGKLMTKIFYIDQDGREQTRSCDKGYLFNFSMPTVACLDDLAGDVARTAEPRALARADVQRVTR
jgi:hypothetical protein